MSEITFAIPNALVLEKIVSIITDMDLNDKDTMGDVYEELLSQTNSAGKMGAFRTPRHIIKRIVELMQPKPNDIICDPAMGTAGFLCAAANYISEKYEKELLNEKTLTHFRNNMFYGFDTQQSMMAIGAMNLMLHNVDNPNLERMDSLSNDNTIKEKYTLIMANPPFAGNLIKGTISDSLTTITNTTRTELLFLALFTRELQIGGRCASIVPDGVLFGSSNAHKAIRKELIDKQRLEAVISMPAGVFQPYSGVKTSIVIFTKSDKGGTDNVWFYDMNNDGYSLNANRTPIDGSNVPDVIKRFHNLKEESNRTRLDQSFMVPVDEIRNNDYDLTINKYKENKKEEKVYRPTSEIMSELESLEKEYANAFEELKTMLGD